MEYHHASDVELGIDYQLELPFYYHPIVNDDPLVTQQGTMCRSKLIQRVPVLAGLGVCFIEQKQASACQTPGTGTNCTCNKAVLLLIWSKL